METNRYVSSYFPHFCLVYEMFQKKIVEEIKKHFALNNVFLKIVPFMR
jgi:hypothetical protein